MDFSSWSDTDLEHERWVIADRLEEREDSTDREEYEQILSEMNDRGIR